MSEGKWTQARRAKAAQRRSLEQMYEDEEYDEDKRSNKLQRGKKKDR